MSGARVQGSGFRRVRIGWIVLFILLAGTALAASTDETRFARIFADAAKAYDENRLSEAIAGWQSLVAEKQTMPAVLFNLGNAYYRNGNLGEAIRAYRRAQTLAPRDPDIRANLGFAAQSAGIVLPARPPVMALLLDFSQREWLAFGVACFWALAFVLGAWIAWPRARFAARPAAAVCAALLLLALAGLWVHGDLRHTPEVVVMRPEQKVLSSPLESATPLLALPAGAIVRQLDRRGQWLEIQYDGTHGWLPAAAVEPVS